MRRAALSLVVASILICLPAGQAPLDGEGERWVEQTMRTLTTEEMVGQLLMPRFSGVYTSSDSDMFDRLAASCAT